MKIGLFFGSFNPIHVGHLIISQHLINETDLDRLWLVVSPQNPFKEKSSLAKDYDRLHLVRLALDDHAKIKASDIEFNLPKPSYTIDTLTYLKEKFPNDQFVLIMGADNLLTFHKWKNADVILRNYSILVYNRLGSPVDSAWQDHPQVKIVDAPLLNISSTFIRTKIKEGKSVQFMLNDKVWDYIHGSSMYKS